MIKIGIISIISSVHDRNVIDKYIEPFINEIKSKVHYEIEDINDIKQAANYDLLFVLVKSGGSENYFTEIYKYLNKPVYIIANFKANSLPAAIEILSYIKQHDQHSEILIGTSDEIADRINRLAKIYNLLEKLKNVKVGVIGKPSDWLISSNVDYQKVKEKWGIELVDIDINEVNDDIKKASPNKDLVEQLQKKATQIIEPSSREITNSLKIYEGINNIVKKYNLNAFTVRCFDILMKFNNTGCPALSIFNDNGITAGCEGDIPAVISMLLVKELTDKPGFMANPSYINTKTNEISFCHCTVPISLTKNYVIRNHFESNKGVGIQGIFNEQDIWLIKLSGISLDKIYTSRGKIIENQNNPERCRTQIYVKLNSTAKYFLTNPSGNHHIISVKNIEDDINLLTGKLNLTTIVS